MNPKMYLVCFAISLLGMLFALALKFSGMQKKARLANAQFSIKKAFYDDWLSTCASFIFILIVLFLIDNLLKWKPVVTDYVKAVFVFVGYFGGDLGSRIFSVTNRRLNSVIDYKTDIADGVKDKTGDVD